MDLPEQLQQRVQEQDIPGPVYAVIGAALRLRSGLAAVPEQAQAQARVARSTKDRWVTTAYQRAHEAREQVAGAPAFVAEAAKARWSQVRDVPGHAGAALSERVIDLRDDAAEHYDDLAGSGERAVAEWHAQRVLDERAERMARSVTPAAAKATVSARDAVRRAAASPTGQKAAAAGRRARQSAKRAVDEYVAAVDDAAMAAQPVSGDGPDGARSSGGRS
jgi:hypothetical protein